MIFLLLVPILMPSLMIWHRITEFYARPDVDMYPVNARLAYCAEVFVTGACMTVAIAVIVLVMLEL